jgi:hypothetical protein
MRDENSFRYVQTSLASSRSHPARCTPRAGFALWLYHRFNLSARDIEDLMSERGVAISYESIRPNTPTTGLSFRISQQGLGSEA